MSLFFNIPEKGCIPGKNIPLLSIHMGCLGDSQLGFPDSGRPVARIGAPRAVPAHVAPGRFVHCRSRRTTCGRSKVLRLCLGCAALTAATTVARAQTYYYYPSTPTSYARRHAGTTAAPVYYVPSTYRQSGPPGMGIRPSITRLTTPILPTRQPIRRSTTRRRILSLPSSRRM